MCSPNKIVILLFLNLFCVTGLLSADKKVVFIAGAKSHGYFSHEHIAGSKLLARNLMRQMWVFNL